MGIEYIKKKGSHHAFHRSEYMQQDKDNDWNLFDLDTDYHRCIHNASNDLDVIRGKQVAKKCREIALKRYSGEHREELISIMKKRYGKNYKK